MLRFMADETWDIFLSHASEDFEPIARPLAEMLERRGVSVWIHEQELVPGRGLVEQINTGLAASRNGGVILSPSFLRKPWTNFELDALVAGRMSRQKLLVPVWHEITAADVSARAAARLSLCGPQRRRSRQGRRSDCAGNSSARAPRFAVASRTP